MRLSQTCAGTVPLSIVDGPPDEVICCLTPTSAARDPRTACFVELVKRAATLDPNVACLL